MSTIVRPATRRQLRDLRKEFLDGARRYPDLHHILVRVPTHNHPKFQERPPIPHEIGRLEVLHHTFDLEKRVIDSRELQRLNPLDPHLNINDVVLPAWVHYYLGRDRSGSGL